MIPSNGVQRLGSRPRLIIQMGCCTSTSKGGVQKFVTQNTTIRRPTQIQDKLDSLYIDDEVCLLDILEEVPLTKMHQLLHKNIGALIAKNKEAKVQAAGTAVLLSPNLLLTVAHNIWQPKKEQIFPIIHFYPGQSGALSNPYKVEKVFFPQQFKKKQKGDPHVDYALLLLSQPVPHAQFIPLESDFKSLEHHKYSLAIYGYPKEKYWMSESGQCTSQWGVQKESTIKIIKNRYIEHDISTSKGHSGSPIIAIRGNKCSIIGIHKGCSRDRHRFTKVNVGKFITAECIEQLQLQAMMLGAQGFGVTVSSINKPTLKSLLKQGQEFYQNNNFQQAIQKYTMLTQKFPNYFRGYFYLANSYQESQKLPEAIFYFEKALQLQPNNQKCLNNLGFAYEATGRLRQAIKAYEKALKHQPRYERALVNLGGCLAKVRQNQKAIQCFKKAIQLKPDYEKAHLNLGLLLMKLGRKEEAKLHLGQQQIK